MSKTPIAVKHSKEMLFNLRHVSERMCAKCMQVSSRVKKRRLNRSSIVGANKMVNNMANTKYLLKRE